MMSVNCSRLNRGELPKTLAHDSRYPDRPAAFLEHHELPIAGDGDPEPYPDQVVVVPPPK